MRYRFPTKSPGPDGYTRQFYRDAWDIVGDEVCDAVRYFFDTGKLLTQINATTITLIPKMDMPTNVKHFRPISCCNVLYKAISKIMCNRLAAILPDIISKNQGAFVKGRSILENILICQDLVRLYNRSMVSPRYHPLCKSLKLTHLLFADDLLMFCKGDVQSIMLLLRALSTFSASSGLRVNASKSEVVFNGVAASLKLDIIQVSGFQECSLPFKSWGIPVQAVRLKRSDCKVLIEKIVCRIRGIGARKLSYAGRLILINSVLNTLHNYWASIFLIPKGVISRIEIICRNFLWAGDAEYQRVPLVAWKKVCCSKKEGGLGVKDARVWNIATVGKLVNWIYTKADRLWVLWIDHVYMKGIDWNSYQPPPDSNWNWRNICKVRTMLAAGFQGTQWLASPNGYTVTSGYQWIQGTHPPVHWYKDVWDGWATPKHSLIGWLIKHEALNTRAKLFSLGLCNTNRCVLCEKEEEGHGHLFGSCDYSSKVVAVLEDWLHINLSTVTGISKIQKKVYRVIRLACWYAVWMERNNYLVDVKLRRPDIVADEIKATVKARLIQVVTRPVLVGDKDWLGESQSRATLSIASVCCTYMSVSTNNIFSKLQVAIDDLNTQVANLGKRIGNAENEPGHQGENQPSIHQPTDVEIEESSDGTLTFKVGKQSISFAQTFRKKDVMCHVTCNAISTRAGLGKDELPVTLVEPIVQRGGLGCLSYGTDEEPEEDEPAKVTVSDLELEESYDKWEDASDVDPPDDVVDWSAEKITTVEGTSCSQKP
ncbi:uncharacterized protein LOC141651715 [Silene latifolia]|uniref:uncharacterized protein LOC141651715 n=1 Tax=Silene latifolia TaxID=37657 RepID=UPI003D77B958